MLTRHRRRGFTLGEVLVAVAITSVLAAIVIPAVKERMRAGYRDAIATELASLATAVQNYKSTVGRYPAKLWYLNALPAVSPTDLCGAALTTANKNAFTGPYITRLLNSANLYYLIADDDSVDFTLYKNAVSVAGVADVAWISVFGVETKTASDLDLLVDGTAGTGVGTLQYVTEANGDQEVRYMIPRKGC